MKLRNPLLGPVLIRNAVVMPLELISCIRVRWLHVLLSFSALFTGESSVLRQLLVLHDVVALQAHSKRVFLR